MTYFKSLLFNFLAVFFANHIIPGIKIDYYTKLPDIKGDIIFSFILGLILSLIFPVLKIFKLSPSHFKIGFITFLISFGAYSLVNILPVGIHITSAGGFIWCSLIVWFCSYLTNHLEYRKYLIEMQVEEKEKEHEELKKKEQQKEMKKEEPKNEKEEEKNDLFTFVIFKFSSSFLRK